MKKNIKQNIQQKREEHITHSKGNKRTNSFRMAKQERKIEIPEQILNSPKNSYLYC